MDFSLPTLARSLILPLLMSLPTESTPAAGLGGDAQGQGTLQTKDAGGAIVQMPLRHTEVRAEVTGFVARVEVIQTFGNPFESAIEANYVFPLPERAAVDDFLLEVGERRIRGEIRRREEARQTYEQARSAGYTASLLDQERPNIFTQSVANIPPGREVKVHLSYIDILPYADGGYRFLYPMVVGPRYSPDPAEPSVTSAGDPARAAYLNPGLRVGNDIAVTLDIDAGVPIRALTSESHKIIVTTLGPTRARVVLAPDDMLPNKDLMLRWEVAGELPEVGLMAHRADEDGFFALLIQPRAEVTAEEAAPKEVIFVLDQSGSMEGRPIEMSKRFMRLALQTLGPRDRFNIVRFDDSATALSPEPLPNTQENVQLGLGAVEEMRGLGGTEMLAGFRAALAQPHDPNCIRIFFFLTDGFIGDDEKVLRAIAEGRGDARIFTLGVGSSVNHHLLRGMAELGHGAYEYVRPDGHEKEAVEQFEHWVTRPYLTDLEIDWGSLRVEDVQPSQLPDLYSGQTLSVVGRYLWGGTDTLIIKGRLGGVPWEKRVDVTLPERSDNNAALASAWARQRLNDLLMRPGEASRPEIDAEATTLALGFRLMSPFTSFVAVDDSVVVNPGGDGVRVEQASPLPEFVSFEASFDAVGPGRTEALSLPRPDTAPPSTSGPALGVRGLEASAPSGQAVILGTVRDTEGNTLPGVVIQLKSKLTGVTRQCVSDVNGRYRIPSVNPSSDYVATVDYAGFAPMEVAPLILEARRTVRLDLTLRTTAETTETITFDCPGNIVDTSSTSTSTIFNAELIGSRPVSGHYHQHVHGARDTGLQHPGQPVSPPEPATGTFGAGLNPDIIEEIEVITSGASAEYGRADGGGDGSSMPGAPIEAPIAVMPANLQFPQANQPIEEAALRVLADLADDGRLSHSEGLPALAGLLAAQYSNGGFSLSVRAQTLATWALSAAAASEPRLRWVPDAAIKAAEFLTLMRSSCGMVEQGDNAWADLVVDMALANCRTGESCASIASMDRCLDVRGSLGQLRGSFGPSGGRLIERILGGLRPPQPDHEECPQGQHGVHLD